MVPAGYGNPSKADGLLKVHGPSLVGELRSHVPLQPKKPKHKQQKKCCKKFNKGFKTVGSKYHHLINSGRLGDMA